MSLVNDMLRDLDERKRQGSSGYRAVVKENKRAGRWFWVAVVIVLMVIAVFFIGGEWRNKVVERGSLDTRTENTPSAVSAQNAEKPQRSTQQLSAVETPPKVVMSVPNKETPTVTNISVINWTSLSPQHGTLTFWLDQVKPFVLYNRTATTLDIAIDESILAAGLPDMDISQLSTIEIIPEAGKSRFKLVAKGPVEFKPQLKQNPARLVIDIISPNAEKLPAVTEKNSESEELLTPLPVIPAKEKASLAGDEPTVVEKAPVSTGEWKKSLNTLPTDSSTVRSAQRLLSQQRTDEALELLKTYVDKAPSSQQSKYLLVQLYLATERYSDVSAMLHNAPDNLSWSLLKARALLQQGQAQQAIQLLEQHPDGQNRQDYLDLLASGYQQAGQHAAAVARYLSLLALNPQEGRWWINLGISLEHLGQRTKALDAYRNALQIPNLDQSLKQYAQLQSRRLMQ